MYKTTRSNDLFPVPLFLSFVQNLTHFCQRWASVHNHWRSSTIFFTSRQFVLPPPWWNILCCFVSSPTCSLPHKQVSITRFYIRVKFHKVFNSAHPYPLKVSCLIGSLNSLMLMRSRRLQQDSPHCYSVTFLLPSWWSVWTKCKDRHSDTVPSYLALLSLCRVVSQCTALMSSSVVDWA